MAYAKSIKLQATSTYNINNFETLINETVMESHLGDNAFSQAQSSYNSMAIGAATNFVYVQVPAGASIVNINITNTDIKAINDRQAEVSITRTGRSFPAGGAYVVETINKGAVHDYKKYHIPNGDIVMVDFGEDIETITYKARGANAAILKPFMKGLSTNLLLDITIQEIVNDYGIVQYAFGEATFIVNAGVGV